MGGYNLPPARQPPGPYPSIPGQVAHGGPGAESFYTGQQRTSYAPTPTQPYHQMPPQPTPQAQYPQATQTHYAPSEPPAPSWQGHGPSVPQDPYAQHQHQQPPTQHISSPPVQTPQQAPGHSMASPSADPQAAYYFGTQQPSQPSQGPSAPGPGPIASPEAPTGGAYPNLQQPPAADYQHRGSVSAQSQPTPTQSYSQPSQAPQQAPTPQQAPPQQSQQQYWQPTVPHQGAVPQQQATPQQGWAYTGYQQPQQHPDQLPSVPNEPIKKPAQEEALIEF